MDAGISGHNLVGHDRQELEQLVAALGKAPYRGRQLYHALYCRREKEFAALTDLDRDFRAALAAHYEIAYPHVQGEFTSKDGAARYLLRLQDNTAIESVYMPEEARITLCLSSQAGCAVDCRFCFTALLGLQRNLSAGEILGQVLAVAKARKIPPRSRLNLVFMGMGEPLLNLAQVMKAVRIFADPQAFAIPLRRLTISTSGIIPAMRELARDPMRPKLAVSLNASKSQLSKMGTPMATIEMRWTGKNPGGLPSTPDGITSEARIFAKMPPIVCAGRAARGARGRSVIGGRFSPKLCRLWP